MRIMRGLALLLALTLALAGCGGAPVEGKAVSPLYDPFRAGGLPVIEGPSGIRDDAPEPVGKVINTDHGDNDRLALLSVNDIEEFWTENYKSGGLDGQFKPIKNLLSYDSEDPDSPRVCGAETYDMANAFFCPPLNVMAWDRSVFVPVGRKFFGDIAISALIGHEYGHAIQQMAGLVGRRTSSLVHEQQADCFAGVYQRWVAEGNSPRFTLSTGDGLNHVLAGAISGRDPILGEKYADLLKQDAHGTALERVSAFQLGFVNGIPACAAIDEDEVEQRRGDLPVLLESDADGRTVSGEVELDETNLNAVMDALAKIFTPQEPPTLSLDGVDCAGPQVGIPVAYCPDSNTVAVDLPALQQLSEPADEYRDFVLLQGDNTGISALTSRYVLAVQRERGVALDSPTAALRTACLTGVAQRAMADPKAGFALRLTAGDIDEAVAGLLVNGIVASNVAGDTVPSGFTRIVAYRSGIEGDAELCYRRFA